MEPFRAARGCFVAWLPENWPLSVGVERNKVKRDSTLKRTRGLLMEKKEPGVGVVLPSQAEGI